MTKLFAVALWIACFCVLLAGCISPPQGVSTADEALRIPTWPADPGVPMHFMAVRKDELVPFSNSLEAFETMQARGVPADFRVLDQSTHENGAYEAYGIALLSLWKAIGL